MVREGFELLGAFNMSDHLPSAFQSLDPLRIRQRCRDLVPRVYAFVHIIDDHRSHMPRSSSESSSFVDVLLHLQAEEKLADSDIVSILWVSIFARSRKLLCLPACLPVPNCLNDKTNAIDGSIV